ncbi:MAG: putative capsid protein [Circoviridae sp.]|nr:MAG: putative capsid protein [Circoviridae sp.]
MPARKRMTRKRRSTLSKSQKREVKRIAEKAVDAEIEDKQYVYIAENVQLVHNIPGYSSKLLQLITQGTADGDQSTGGTTKPTCRVGDQISLRNVNIRMWLSNKLDRPNVMYKGVLYWYPVNNAPSNAQVYKTQTNKMLDRYNDKDIQIIDTFILQSGPMYLNGTEKFEHSYLATLNKSYKNKKITYDGLTGVPKGKDLGFSVVCYDAYGTLQTDNIASFAWNMQLTFQDA